MALVRGLVVTALCIVACILFGCTGNEHDDKAYYNADSPGDYTPEHSGVRCGGAEDMLNSCNGTRVDCFSEGKKLCNMQVRCKGVMWHRTWSESGQYQICTKSETSPDLDGWYTTLKIPRFIVGSTNTADCPDGSSHITTYERCNKAANKLGAKYNGNYCSEFWKVGGCSQMSTDGDVSFCSNPIGAKNESAAPVCEEVW